MENKYITYTEYNNRINKYNQARTKGFKLIIKKNWFKLVLGVVCLGVAIFPNGSGIIMYPISFYLLGIGLLDLEDIKRKIKNKIRGLQVFKSVTPYF